MNEIYLHNHSSEYKEAYEVIFNYFGGLTFMLESNVSGYCKLLHAQKNGWDVNRLYAESKRADDLSNPERSYWWSEWLLFVDYFENEFGIRFPKEIDFDEDSEERVLGVNYDISIEKMAEMISLLMAEEELPNEFLRFENIPNYQENVSSKWSDELISLTKNVLIDLPIASFLNDGHCILKSIYRKFGKISLDDAISYQYRIKDIDTGELQVSFETLDDLIDAGWVVD
jgi:hypothetical protein